MMNYSAVRYVNPRDLIKTERWGMLPGVMLLKKLTHRQSSTVAVIFLPFARSDCVNLVAQSDKQMRITSIWIIYFSKQKSVIWWRLLRGNVVENAPGSILNIVPVTSECLFSWNASIYEPWRHIVEINSIARLLQSNFRWIVNFSTFIRRPISQARSRPCIHFETHPHKNIHSAIIARHC